MLQDRRNADRLVDTIDLLATLVAVKARVMNADHRSGKVKDRCTGSPRLRVAVMRKIGKRMSIGILGIHLAGPGTVRGTLDAATPADLLHGAIRMMHQEDIVVIFDLRLGD